MLEIGYILDCFRYICPSLHTIGMGLGWPKHEQETVTGHCEQNKTKVVAFSIALIVNYWEAYGISDFDGDQEGLQRLTSVNCEISSNTTAWSGWV